MPLEILLQTTHLKMPVTVQTSGSFLQQLDVKKVDLDLIKRDIGHAISEEIETWNNFSPDKTKKKLDRVELFLFCYQTPDMPLTEEMGCGHMSVKVEPPKTIEGERKFGWGNSLALSGGAGYYEFLITNGYYYLS